MTTYEASVIIPVWNGIRYLAPCLDALLAQQGVRFEVIAVDNGSTDGSADMLDERYPGITVVRNPANLGFSGACNAGIRVANGRILLLLNQDTEVRPGWLSALVAALSDPVVGVAGCKAHYPDGRTIQHAGARVAWPLALPSHDGQGERDTGQWDEAREVDYVTGAALAVRRDVMERVGLLDEGFWPGYFEDADLCYRAREAGYGVRYVPQASLVHHETTSLTDVASISRAYHRGRLRFVLKHVPPERFLDEFVPAEHAYQCERARRLAADVLRPTYLEAMIAACEVIPARWSDQVRLLEPVLDGLQVLFQSSLGDAVSVVPPLREFQFRSSTPVVGPLIGRVRALWYSVAARWAMRYLMQQQEAINQQQEVYVRAVIAMARQMARLATQSARSEQERTL
ncbi:MAG: glycosyltransferase family 2 protein [Anaerolineae bacterium]|nr:glycosyltransferase family 2 protein [Anaerolineae bacterium]